VERKANKKSYRVVTNTWSKLSRAFGADHKTYIDSSGDSRSFLDHIDSNHAPYCVALTLLIESPMKLYVQN